MSEYVIQGQTLTGIADAIRAQLGTEQQYTPESMAAAIGSIQGVDAPEESILKISALGTGLASVSPSAAGKMQGLKLYGRSWQDGTPSVEQEVPIQSVGDSGMITAFVLNRMDFEFLPLGIGSGDKFVTVPGNYAVSAAISVPDSKKVYIHTDFSLLNSGAARVLMCNEYPSVGVSYTRIDNVRADGEFTLPDGYRYAVFYFMQNAPQYVEDIHRLSVIADRWVQMQVLTPNGLPGIPVDSGGNWVDENGQQWMSDVVDFEAGTKTQYVFKEELKLSYSSQYSRYEGIVSNGIKAGSLICLCNVGVYKPTPANSGECRVVPNSQQFILKSDIEVDSCTVLYVLATPIITPLTDEELTTYKALQSYDGTTNVIAPNAGIEATAYGNAAEYVSQHTAIQDAAQAAKILLGMEDV